MDILLQVNRNYRLEYGSNVSTLRAACYLTQGYFDVSHFYRPGKLMRVKILFFIQWNKM